MHVSYNEWILVSSSFLFGLLSQFYERRVILNHMYTKCNEKGIDEWLCMTLICTKSNYDWTCFYLQIYTVLHIFRQVLFGAGNQGNHWNSDLSLLSYKCWLIFIGMKQKKISYLYLKQITECHFIRKMHTNEEINSNKI